MFKYGHTVIDHVGLDIDLTDLSDVFGKILSKNGKKEDAVKAFNKALEIDSINGSDAYGELAVLNFELKIFNGFWGLNF
jgi:hypothetical protein